jgi:hypothetical protein
MDMQCAVIVTHGGYGTIVYFGTSADGWGLGLCEFEMVEGCANDGLHVEVDERCLKSVSMVVVVISITQYSGSCHTNEYLQRIQKQHIVITTASVIPYNPTF